MGGEEEEREAGGMGICANKIILQYDLIGHLIGNRMILLERTRGGP
jgi:hypothetical protein